MAESDQTEPPLVEKPAPPSVKYIRPPLDTRLLGQQGVKQQSTLPGHQGLPFRGPVPFIKEDDNEEKQPKVGYEVRVDIFELKDDEDRKYYSQVWQLASSGFAIISSEEKVYDVDVKNWRIFLRWALTYTYMPDEVPHG